MPFRLRRFTLFLVAIAIVCVCGILLTVPAYAQQDTTPPKLLDVKFEPEVIDTSNGSQTITVTIHVTDDLSGIDYAHLFFRNVGSTQYVLVNFHATGGQSEMIEGDVRNGHHRATMVVPQYAAFGKWEMDSVSMGDSAGNRTSELKPAGGPEDYEQYGWSSFYDRFGFWNGPEEFALYLPTVAP